MLASELRRTSTEYSAELPLCPNCGRPMYLARVTPRAEGLADLGVFKCGECAVWLTQSTDERGAI